MTSDPQEVCALCVQWRCAVCKSHVWPECCGHPDGPGGWLTESEPYWPDGTVATLTVTTGYCRHHTEIMASYRAERESG